MDKAIEKHIRKGKKEQVSKFLESNSVDVINEVRWIFSRVNERMEKTR